MGNLAHAMTENCKTNRLIEKHTIKREMIG